MAFKRIKDWATSIASFRSGDVIPVDGPSGTAKMGKDDLLKETAQNALAGNVAPAFDPTRTSENPYKAGESVTYEGKTYTFKVGHYGAWNSSHVTQRPINGSFLNVPVNAIFSGLSSNPTDMNDLKDNLYQVIQGVTSSNISNLPPEYTGRLALLVVSKQYISSSRYWVMQTIYELADCFSVYFRNYDSYSGGIWTAWSPANIAVRKQEIIYDWSQNPADLNDFKSNVIIRCAISAGTQTQHFPTGYTGDGLLVVVRALWNNGYRVLQKLTRNSDGASWYRTYTFTEATQTGLWGDWTKSAESLLVRSNGIVYGWNQNPADLNDLQDNVIVGCIVNSSTQTLHFPSDYSGEGFLICLRYYFSGGYRVLQKLTRNNDGATWYRIFIYLESSQSGSWGAWTREPENVNLVTIGSGKMYSRLRDGFEAAFNIPNCKVVIYPGIYDLTVECSDILATTLSANFCPCKLGNGMHVVFMEGAKVTCNIEKGEMSDAQFDSIKEHFEPMAFYFSGDNGDFTLENAVIESKNCRYCVHDDLGATTKPYIHKYINCRMYRTNSNITPSVNFVPCIGGGLGKNGTILIEGGWYRTEPVVGSDKIMNGDLDYQQWPISYHNGNVEDAQSFITIKNVYFADKGYFMTQDYGPSILKTKCYISGCRFGLPPMVGLRTETTNFELTAEWNNSVAVEGEWQVDPEDSSKTIFVASNP